MSFIQLTMSVHRTVGMPPYSLGLAYHFQCRTWSQVQIRITTHRHFSSPTFPTHLLEHPYISGIPSLLAQSYGVLSENIGWKNSWFMAALVYDEFRKRSTGTLERAIAWHRSQWDLQEMMKRALLVTTTIRLPPMCRERPVSPVIERTWWKEHGSDPSMSFKYRFLENLSFPPCLSGNNPSLLPPHAHDRIRPMDVVSFDRTWLFDRLALIPISDIPPDLRRLEMIMHSHLEPPPWSQVKDFSVYMWPTNGPYDELIRRIAKWVIEDGGSCVSVGRSSTQRADETFGYRKDHWCLVLELQLDAPRYLWK
ncbi:hypothetical protein BS47DRAFT_1399682 [Hydnum rufescens UP504]|uniref:Uncharacterized protein n=1 Tax=Hydnum rufescens UP504 TaxID=1448309 RepID=A0A9P6DQ34_9AGAM|nr:hypothetical protein BS47DRAFT_1399682 [Hydnum rufescens UP504]